MRNIAALGAFADEIADFRGEFGQWVVPAEEAGEFDRPPQPVASELVRRFVDTVHRDGWLLEDLDWRAWVNGPEGQRLLRSETALAAATPEELACLLTALVEEDRISKGALFGHFESGLIGMIARRAAVLAAERPGHG
jgi:hypothetical protein